MPHITEEQGWPEFSWFSAASRDAAISFNELRGHSVYADAAALCMLSPDLPADYRVSVAQTLGYTLNQIEDWEDGRGGIDPSTAQARVDALGRVGQLILSDERSN